MMSNWYLPLYDALSWFACFHKYNISPPKGKVHGSLARAGKVRGQTPKVSLHCIPTYTIPYKNVLFL